MINYIYHRDRTWSLHQINNQGSQLSTTLVARTDKKTSVHTRLIWACAWAPDGKHFFTVAIILFFLMI